MSICASSSQLESNTPDVLASMLLYFDDKLFLKHQPRAFPEFVLLSPHTAEETDFKRTAPVTPLAEVLKFE